MKGIDHLVYTTVDLEEGMNEIEELLGVRPIYGGQHPDFGTHNALLSLGRLTYLEIIAPCPDLAVPDNGLPFGLEHGQKSCIATWAYRSVRIEDQVVAAGLAGIDVGAIANGSRRKADGTMLSWKLTDPCAMLLGGAVPFLIDWGKTQHPASNVLRAGELIGLRIEHPQPARVSEALSALCVKTDIDIQRADAMRIVAMVMTRNGEVDLC